METRTWSCHAAEWKLLWQLPNSLVRIAGQLPLLRLSLRLLIPHPDHPWIMVAGLGFEEDGVLCHVLAVDAELHKDFIA